MTTLRTVASLEYIQTQKEGNRKEYTILIDDEEVSEKQASKMLTGYDSHSSSGIFTSLKYEDFLTHDSRSPHRINFLNPWDPDCENPIAEIEKRVNLVREGMASAFPETLKRHEAVVPVYRHEASVTVIKTQEKGLHPKYMIHVKYGDGREELAARFDNNLSYSLTGYCSEQYSLGIFCDTPVVKFYEPGFSDEMIEINFETGFDISGCQDPALEIKRRIDLVKSTFAQKFEQTEEEWFVLL